MSVAPPPRGAAATNESGWIERFEVDGDVFSSLDPSTCTGKIRDDLRTEVRKDVSTLLPVLLWRWGQNLMSSHISIRAGRRGQGEVKARTRHLQHPDHRKIALVKR